jgi:dimethylaniline monooxygenase (N-oxide forming)
MPSFPGQDTFTGTIMHSVKYKDYTGLEGKRVLIIGIGNSAVDVASNLVSATPHVALSTRTGAYIVPNYLYGTPTDHFACRGMLALPLKVWGKMFADTIYNIQGTSNGTKSSLLSLSNHRLIDWFIVE